MRRFGTNDEIVSVGDQRAADGYQPVNLALDFDRSKRRSKIEYRILRDNFRALLGSCVHAFRTCGQYNFVLSKNPDFGIEVARAFPDLLFGYRSKNIRDANFERRLGMELELGRNRLKNIR